MLPYTVYPVIYLVNRLDHFRDILLDSKREAVRGESIGKAVRDIMRLSSGLKYVEYVLVRTVVFEWFKFMVHLVVQFV